MTAPILSEIMVSDGNGGKFKATILPAINSTDHAILNVVWMEKGLRIEERIERLVLIANDRHQPVALTIGSIGLLANPGDEPGDILQYFQKVLARK